MKRTMYTRLLLPFIIAAAAVTACGDDAGSGSTGLDAGTVDSGDAGVGMDVGSDGGTTVPDAEGGSDGEDAATDLDTGTTDAGATDVDAATDPVDGATDADGGPTPPVTTVRVLHFNDLHANLTPRLDRLRHAHEGGVDVVIGERGGIARLKTLIDRLRDEAEHSILTNVGDTFHGGVEAMFTNGNAIAAPLNALGIDIGTMGNWDFAFGPGVTQSRYGNPCTGPMCDESIERPNFPNIVANVTDTRPRPAGGTGESWLEPTRVIDRGGVRVGFIGFTSDIVPRMHPTLAGQMTFLGGNDGLSAAEAEVAYRDRVHELAADLRDRQDADVVIVLSELGIQKDKRLADIITPGTVDVFLSAHTHEVTYEPIVADSGALVVEAGNDGYLGAMDIDVAEGAVVDMRWTLHEITMDIPEDPEVAALVAAARAPFLGEAVNLTAPGFLPGSDGPTLTTAIDTVVGEVNAPLDRRHALENTFNNAFTDMLRAEAGTQIAISPGFRFDAILLPEGEPLENEAIASGEVTLEQVYRFFPVSYTLGTGEITGENLRGLIEEALNLVFSPEEWEQSGGWVEGFSGLDIEVDLSQPVGSRVTGLRIAEAEAVDDADVLTVGGCRRPFDEDDVLCSYPGFANVNDLTQGGQVLTPQELFIQGLSGTITPRDSITDTNATRVWPETPFIQPLEGVE